MKKTIPATVILGALLAGCATPGAEPIATLTQVTIAPTATSVPLSEAPTGTPTDAPSSAATATPTPEPTHTPTHATPTSEPTPTATLNPCAPERATWDAEACGLPQIVAHDYVELGMIATVSKFRSCEGHEYSDDFEAGSSMKHYFKPKESVDWSQVAVYSPIEGQIIRIVEESWEGSGRQVLVQSVQYPAFIFHLFHVQPLSSLQLGLRVAPGELIGHHIGRQTLSDVAIDCRTSAGRRNVSYFELMPDSVFAAYQARGVASRTELIVSPDHRRANPCAFVQGDPADWVPLM